MIALVLLDMDNNQLEGTDPDDLALIASELELETELTLSLSPSVWLTTLTLIMTSTVLLEPPGDNPSVIKLRINQFLDMFC